MAEETLVTTLTEPLGNSPEARTPTGEIVDQSAPVTSQTDSTNVDTPAPRVPETYAAFSAPEGLAIDPALIEQAAPIFKELGLNQAQAQKLVDIAVKRQQDAISGYQAMRADWVDQVNKDPEIGGKLDAVKAEIGKLYDAFGGRNDPAIKSFISAMDLTGAGDNPAFIKLFYKMAQKVNEGKHVTAGAPSPEGQRSPNTPAKPSAAASMYPNLV